MRRYRDARRRLLVDMHIPDWDERFLAAYEPRAMAEAARASGAEAVMLYFQSHLGLCYYPTSVGTRHRAAATRDLAGEALAALSAAGIPVCAYYSVNFNNRAWLDRPEWRLEPAAPATVGILPRERYGIVCLNNPRYRDFVRVQVDEITTYPIDAMFFDMMWWNGVCICQACRARYRLEADAEIPTTVDWSDATWTRFQHARECWLAEFAIGLRMQVRRRRPELDVYHNFALGLSNWTRGISLECVAGHDFLGGDFYGGPAEQLLITRLMRNLTPNAPAEFMTTAAAGLTEHTRLRSPALMQTKALAALSANLAFLAIVAIDPDGRIDPEAIARVRAAFDTSKRFDVGSAGTAIEQVGVYFSDASRMNFAQNGSSIANAPASSLPDYPHFEALSGACRILQQAHLPFGVVTGANLHELGRWQVLVLPNLQRMSAEEVQAIRSFVADGGRVYASRSTSLVDAAGGGAEQFALGDVFGVRAQRADNGRLVYARAVSWPEPRRPIAHWRTPNGNGGTLHFELAGAETLVALTLPYAHPHPGTAADTNWASIHSSPPWVDTERPLIARHRFGRGVVIYSGIDVETGKTPEHDALFLSLIRNLLPTPRVTVDTHPNVWASAFDEPSRVLVSLLNYQLDEMRLPVPAARVSVRLPPGRRCIGVVQLPERAPVDFERTVSGAIEYDAGPLDLFRLHAIEHVAATS